MELNQVVIQLFTNDVLQENCCVYPELNTSKTYRLNGQLYSGAQLQNEGIDIPLHSDWEDHYPMFKVQLEAV